VAARSPGYASVGWQQQGESSTGLAWFSAGLSGWAPALLPAADGDTRVTGVAALGAGFVSVGESGGHPAAWLSSDGTAWRQLTLALPAGATSATLTQVAAAGETVAAVGTEVTAAGQQVPFAATSTDGGASGQQAALPATGLTTGTAGQSLAVTALAATGTGFTATGTVGTPGNQDVVIWTYAAAGGGSWTAADPDGFGLSGSGVQDITALAAAGTALTGAGFIATESGEQPTIWQSPIRG
jgi:hypothetical protein